MAKNELKQSQSTPSLIFCIAMDVLGGLTYLFPSFGESIDIIWAPISAYVFYRSFGGKTGRVGSLINFVEELLPFSDFVPTFCLGYLYEKMRKS